MALVDDSELRISLAQKHQCHDIVINVRLGAKASQSELWAGCVTVLFANQTYRDLKDRQQLIRYRGKVERGSAEEKMIDELLSNLVRAAGHSYYDFLSCDLTHSASCSSKSGGRTNLQT